MKILFTCNGLLKGNGVRSAVLSLKSRLQEEGLDVRVMASENDDKNDIQPDYPLKHFVFPFFEPIVASNGFRYARIDRDIIRKAVGWADVIHLMEGFPLEAAVAKIARQMGKPCVGTYHIFTENITANLGLGEVSFINRLINLWWKKSTYDHCISIQCPTQTVRDYLSGYGYAAKLEVISNGVDISDPAPVLNDPDVKPYRIISIGRLANEKSHHTLINALRHSKYASDIELYIAGKGPKAKTIKKAAHKLFTDGVVKHDPVFGFYTHRQLVSILQNSYLYVHCATIEVEGLSCLEAIRQGVVPVIADARLSATSQFALDERSLFKASDPKMLAERIDWWIEHPEERKIMSRRYAASVRRYDIRESTRKIIDLYEDALGDAKV